MIHRLLNALIPKVTRQHVRLSTKAKEIMKDRVLMRSIIADINANRADIEIGKGVVSNGYKLKSVSSF